MKHLFIYVWDLLYKYRVFNIVYIYIIVLLSPVIMSAQDTSLVIALWSNGAPGFEDRMNEPELAQDYWVRNIHNPSLTVYFPPKDKATGAAVLVCPGGGFRELVFEAEGIDAAKYLNSIGVAAFVLKYRLPGEEDSPYNYDNVEQDAYRAMRLVRSRSSEWEIDPNRIGIMGFSAGAIVAAFVAYESGDGDIDSDDPIERVNGKPDFQILVYPGPLGVPEVIPVDAPPVFLVAAIDDPCCSGQTIELLNKYHSAGLSAEAHIYAQGAHAFNMGQWSELITLKTWPNRLGDWMIDSGLLKPMNISEE